MKRWYESWTVWANLVALVLLALALPEVGAIIPPAAQPYIAAATAVANLVLRVTRTSAAIGGGQS